MVPVKEKADALRRSGPADPCCRAREGSLRRAGDMLELEGAGWKGDLEAMRRSRVASR